ncbi:MAG: sigma-70 family RNA polymerase sigma factor [Planctomycetes bacterium]|nr:sigma-70 family RNA polymerase sigma factor [Planctomycetota bacterium]
MADPKGPPTDLIHALLEEASWVRRLASRLARDQAAAEDVSQDALALALERRPPVRASLRPWLARVAVRLARHATRADLRRADHEREGALRRTLAADDERQLERLELQERLARYVRELPEPYRRVVMGRYYEGRSAAEMARQAGVSAATTRSQLARGVDHLRRRFEREAQAERPETMHGAALGLLLAAGADASKLTQGGLFVKTTTKVAALLCVVGLLGIGGALYLEGLGAPQPEVVSTASGSSAADGALASAPGAGEGRAATEKTEGEESTRLQLAPREAAEQREPAGVTTLLADLVDDSGEGVLGAEFCALGSESGLPGADGFAIRGAGRAISDAAGRARIELPDELVRHSEGQVFEMTFRASAPMRETKFVRSTPQWHGTTDLGDIVLPRGGALRGRVLETNGAAVPNAIVHLARGGLAESIDVLRIAGPDRGIRRPVAISGADGSFEFPGAPGGACRLLVGAEGRLWAVSPELYVRIGSWTDAGTLVLDPLPSEEAITGVVLRPGGEPAAGAHIAYLATETQDEGLIVAGEDGRFLFSPGGAQAVDLIARDPRGQHGMSATLRAERGARDLRVELTPKRSLALRVVDEETGQPVEGAQAMPLGAEGHQFEAGGSMIVGQGWSRSGADGEVLLDLPPFAARLVVRHGGYETAQLGPWLPTQMPASLTLPLRPRPVLEGRVSALGEPVEGAEIVLATRPRGRVPIQAGFPLRLICYPPQEVRTDADGHFVCPVDPEWSEVFVLASAPGWARGETGVALEAGKGRRGIEVALTRGGTVTGRVTGNDASTARQYVVAASCGDGNPLVTRTDGDGAYRFDRVRPGPWRVVALLEEPSTELISMARTPEDADFRWNVEVVNDKTVILDLDARALLETQLFGRFSSTERPRQASRPRWFRGRPSLSPTTAPLRPSTPRADSHSRSRAAVARSCCLERSRPGNGSRRCAS